MATYSGPGFVLYNGVPVLQSSSVGFDIQTDNKDVNTLLLGRAGHSRGAKKVQVQVDNAIPLAGYEVDWPAIAQAQAEIVLGFHFGAKTYTCSGDVRDVSIKSSVDAANVLSFTFHGKIVATV